ncbi:MAG: lipocalin-like domain-containing protein [Bacteroidaceae bacterium]|nr:lipocalin-like domain-containing protein [Bacteroidaceae bacterium]
MRRILSIIIFSLVTLASCELEVSDNGKLDGFWLIMTVDTVSTGGSRYVAEEFNTWSFQYHALQFRNAIGEVYITKINHPTADSIIVSDVYHNENDTLVTDPLRLSSFGISALPDKFRILHLSDDELRLTDGVLTLNMRKY